MTRICKLLTAAALVAAPCAAGAAPTRHHARHAPKPPSQDRLRRVLDPGMLSLEAPAFEAVAGPALKVSADGSRDYAIDGCQVTALTSGTTVTGLKLTLGDTCSFDLNKFFLFDYAFPPVNQMTLGDFTKTLGAGKITADCLDACADGSVATVHDHFVGSIYLARLQIKFDLKIDDDARRAALERWTSAMRAGGGADYLATARYNCDPRFDPAAEDAFAKLKPSAVTIGYNLKAPKC
ncbi:MAG: hypothetical protein JWP92_160 [Caulobacter sp.]|nr:hypothetical protein [Caulobacter sp.]